MHIRDWFLIVFVLPLASPGVFADEVTHVIEKGETLYGISRSYNVPVSAVRDANDIQDPRDLAVGVELIIPSVYRVEKGDTYYGIARRYDISVDELLELNGRKSSSTLREGDTLYVPELQGEADDRPESETNPGDSDSDDFARIAQPLNPYDTSGYWPHPGRRVQMDGKLPGVSIQGSIGDDVVSVSSGRVIYAGPYTTFGRVVIVQSASGYIYVYGGNRSLTVDVGDLVQPGTTIGELGEAPDTGRSRLYFSVWKNDSFVDPSRAPRS
ncbi:MAG: LysM peptidoglycan-binding domain-containing protein [Spirochaetaceae bacterium]